MFLPSSSGGSSASSFFLPEHLERPQAPHLPPCRNPIFLLDQPIGGSGEFLFVRPIVGKEEGYIFQEELVRRVSRMGHSPAGQQHAQALLEGGVPEWWNGPLFFPGTWWIPSKEYQNCCGNPRHLDLHLFIPVLMKENGSWTLEFHDSMEDVFVCADANVVLVGNVRKTDIPRLSN